MRLHWWVLLCLFICRAHLYATGQDYKTACQCCDDDGCDIVEKNAPPPMMPFTLTWFRHQEQVDDPKDDRAKLIYDAD